MTIRDIGSAMLRRWFVVFLAVALAIAGGYFLDLGKGVYTAVTVVSFIHPGETNLSPNSGLDDSNLVAFAGVVAREVSNGRSPAIYSEDDAPIYGAGIRQGVVVSLPNSGNQWVTSYHRAEIVLQIAGPSEKWVAQTQGDLLARIVQVTHAQQATVKSEASRIHASTVELTKTIYHVVPSRTATIAAFFALLTAALIVGGWGAVLVDGALRRRKMRASRQKLPRLASEGPKL